MRKILLVFAAFCALQSCAESGLIPASGAPVTIPNVKIGCNSVQCSRNATAPLISVVYTTSSCSDPLFGAVVSASTQSINCSSSPGIGCTGTISNWVSSSGSSTTTIASGTYQVCGCIQFSGGSTPWASCDSLGTVNSQSVTGGGLVQILSWNP